MELLFISVKENIRNRTSGGLPETAALAIKGDDMHLKRIASISLLVTLLATCFSFAGEQLTRSEVFYSGDKDFAYAAQETIKENGRTYHLKNIDYEILKKPDAVEKTAEVKGLKEEKAPKTRAFTIDGKKVKLFLNASKTTYTKVPAEEKYVYQAEDPYTFKPDQSRSFRNEGGQTVTGTLKDTVKGSIYKKAITIPGRFTGEEGAKYFYFANTGNLWPLNTSAPTWQGYERDILTYLGLNPASYGITGGRWTGETHSGGNVIKTASFSGTKNVCDYTCTYTVQGGEDIYTANAVYSGYKVKAIMTYEPYMSLKTKIMIGAAIGIAAIAIAAILYFLKRKKKDEKEQG